MGIPSQTDVLVVGGGPTGLLISYMLLRGGHKVCTIEQYDKFETKLTVPTYGRACMVYPGTLELLDLAGIYDQMGDIGYITQGGLTYKDGVATESRGWSFAFKAIAGKTQFEYCLSIRQKHVERVILDAITKIDANTVHSPAKLLDYRQQDSKEYPVVAVIERDGKSFEVACKYLVGADGGRSTVRKIGQFPFPGTASALRWVRLDAIVETNMPHSRKGAIALESKSFGNVLWTPTDNNYTRIGFVYPSDLPNEDITEDVIISLAKKALEPFTLEFKKMDWWTVYAIGQHVAERYRQGNVFLAGDAAHTHSSGAAQGMNTGVHDAFNLAWKLNGQLNGTFQDCVLDTYQTERRSSAQHLIQLDRDISSLISGKIPEHFNAPPNADFNEYLEIVYTSNAQFTVGLGISYEPNSVNHSPPVSSSEPSDDIPSGVKIGHRCPDPPLFRPIYAHPQRLRSYIRFTGRFFVLIFAGKLVPRTDGDGVRLNSHCTERYQAIRSHIDSPSFPNNLSHGFEFLTIVRGEGSVQSAETLGNCQPLGKTLFDKSGEAYSSFGIKEDEGGIVGLRPDAIVSFISGFSETGVKDLEKYLQTIIKPSSSLVTSEATLDSGRGKTGGEISIEGMEESVQF